MELQPRPSSKPQVRLAARFVSFEAIAMRFLPGGVFALILMATPVLALDAGDTMQAWASASPKDKDDLLRNLDAAGGGNGSRDRVRSCLDDTSKTAGHSNLPISEVAKACSEQAARENI
jgi:hypothetical protein